VFSPCFSLYPAISLPFIALPQWLRIAGCTGAETGAFLRARLAIVSAAHTDECWKVGAGAEVDVEVKTELEEESWLVAEAKLDRGLAEPEGKAEEANEERPLSDYDLLSERQKTEAGDHS